MFCRMPRRFGLSLNDMFGAFTMIVVGLLRGLLGALHE